MIIKNGEVESFANFLMKLELKGRESRMRTRFFKILAERQKLIDEEHQELLKQYSNLNEDGSIKTVEKDGKIMADVKDKIGFNREYFMLLNEDFVIEENEERREMIESVRDIVLNCDLVFSGSEALEYDRYCEILEDVYKDQ